MDKKGPPTDNGSFDNDLWGDLAPWADERENEAREEAQQRERQEEQDRLEREARHQAGIARDKAEKKRREWENTRKLLIWWGSFAAIVLGGVAKCHHHFNNTITVQVKHTTKTGYVGFVIRNGRSVRFTFTNFAEPNAMYALDLSGVVHDGTFFDRSSLQNRVAIARDAIENVPVITHCKVLEHTIAPMVFPEEDIGPNNEFYRQLSWLRGEGTCFYGGDRKLSDWLWKRSSNLIRPHDYAG